MSNLKEPLLNNEFFPDDSQKNAELKRVLDDLYQNSSFKDVELETITPDKRSMVDGESKLATVDGEVRKYYRVGNDLYYQPLTKVTENNYIKLKETDADGTIEAQIWYDKSEDKIKLKTGSGVETVRSSEEGYILLKVTDTDGATEGELWYDASEEKLKFRVSGGVETITSS